MAAPSLQLKTLQNDQQDEAKPKLMNKLTENPPDSDGGDEIKARHSYPRVE